MKCHNKEVLASYSRKSLVGFWKELRGSRIILILYSSFIILMFCLFFFNNLVYTAYFYVFFIVTLWFFLYFLYLFKTADYKPFERIGFWLFIILVISPLSVYTIFLFVEGHLFFLPEIGYISDWIGFTGSILGGSITMLAVYFTLKTTRSENDKRLSAELTPIIKCRLTDPDKSKNQEIYVSNNKIHIYIHNTSNKHALITKSKNSYIKLQEGKKHFIDSDIEEIMNENNAVAGNSRRNLQIPFPVHESANQNMTQLFYIRVFLVYSDFLGLRNHQLNYEYDGKITFSSADYSSGSVVLIRRLNTYKFNIPSTEEFLESI